MFTASIPSYPSPAPAPAQIPTCYLPDQIQPIHSFNEYKKKRPQFFFFYPTKFRDKSFPSPPKSNTLLLLLLMHSIQSTRELLLQSSLCTMCFVRPRCIVSLPLMVWNSNTIFFVHICNVYRLRHCLSSY